jgi:hypothetical protein
MFSRAQDRVRSPIGRTSAVGRCDVRAFTRPTALLALTDLQQDFGGIPKLARMPLTLLHAPRHNFFVVAGSVQSIRSMPAPLTVPILHDVAGVGFQPWPILQPERIGFVPDLF